MGYYWYGDFLRADRVLRKPQYYQAVVEPIFKRHLNVAEKIPLHDGCPFITGSLIWGR